MLCLENTPMSHSCVTAHGFSDPDLSSAETEPAERLRLFPLQFTGLSVTSGADQLVVLHSTSQDDILLCLQRGELCPNQDRVGELVGSMVDHFTRSVLGEENQRKEKKISAVLFKTRASHPGFAAQSPVEKPRKLIQFLNLKDAAFRKPSCLGGAVAL